MIAIFRIYPIAAWVRNIVPQSTNAPNDEDRQEIMNGVRRQLPTSAFYVLQGQIVLLILSLYANNITIAGYGALLRIIALLAPVRTLNNAFFVPIAAKAKFNVCRTILLLSAASAIPGIALIFIGLLFPDALLLLIGPQYRNLQDEIIIMVFSAAFMITGGSFWNLVIHRGWVKRSVLQIPINIMWILIAALTLDLSTISGALILNAGFTGSSIIIGLTELWLNSRTRST